MKKIILSIGIIVSFLLTGCTYKTATISYKKYNTYTQNLGGNVAYKEIAPIDACASGFIWDDCSKITSRVLQRLQEKSQTLGGNGVIKVQWFLDNQTVLMPTCKEEWGWFAIYILPGFGPWVQKACAEGIAVKFLDKKNFSNKRTLY